MKILHMADIHLDSKMESNLDRDKAKTRRTELLITFTGVVNYAKDSGVKAILIAGDLFDTTSPSANTRHTIEDLIAACPEIDFYVLKGNHDADDFLSDLEGLPNLHLFGPDWTEYKLDEEGNICLYGRELTATTAADSALDLSLDPLKYNIVMLHGQEAAAQTKQKAEIIPLKSYRNRGIDYMALGHIHAYKEEKLDERGIYCYPGCLEGRGFDECGQHGFMILDVDVEAKKATTKFIPFAARTLFEVRVDVTGLLRSSQMRDRMEAVLTEEAMDASSLVKVVLCGDLDPEAEKDLDYLTNCFCADYFFLKVKDETHYLVHPEEYLLDASLKGEFVRLVMAEDSLSEEEKGRIIHCGLKSLAGEEAFE